MFSCSLKACPSQELSSVSVSPPSTTTTTTTLLLLAYSHPQLPWVEREADKKSSEADSPSLTAQKGKITVMTTARITNVEDLDHV